jgi:two-component system alkaline phosphatase synthesis response regulator PhoP
MIAKYLIEHSSEVVSRDDLLDAIWGYHNYPTNRTVDNFILKLRKIFEKNPNNPVFLETVRGVGYRFVPPKKK